VSRLEEEVVVAMLVQVRSRSGDLLARQVVADPEEALALGVRWLQLMVEDAADPIYGSWDVPAVEVLPEVDDR
jgi:hypothetical protein